MNRRRFLVGASLALAVPAIIRTPGLLMPVKPIADQFGEWQALVAHWDIGSNIDLQAREWAAQWGDRVML